MHAKIWFGPSDHSGMVPCDQPGSGSLVGCRLVAFRFLGFMFRTPTPVARDM